jgi:large repetitive protein
MSHLKYSTRVFLLAALLLIAVPAFAQFSITTSTLPGGSVGQSYNATITTTGGVPPVTFIVTGGSLPPGLSLSQGSGIIFGTPQSAGTYAFTVTAEGSAVGAAQIDTADLEITITSGLTILPATLPSASVGTPYSVQLSATGSGPYYFSFAESGQNPPPWLNLSSAGLLSGTPPAQGNFPITIGVYDEASQAYAESQFVLIVNASVTFVTTTLPSGTAGLSYSYTLQAAGGQPPYTFGLATGSLPSGMNLSPAGVISGTPSVPSFTTFSARVTDSTGAQAIRPFTLDIQVPPIDFTPTTLPNGAVGTPYASSFNPVGVGQSFAFSLQSGSLPPGLSLSSAGLVSGTPTSAGAFSFSVRLSSGQLSVTKAIQMAVQVPPLEILTTSLGDGQVGSPFAAQVQAQGGVPPHSFRVASGALPPGVTMNSSGALSGTPSVSGTYTLSVEVTDSATGVASKSYTIVVYNPLTLSPSSLPAGKINTPYQLQMQASGGLPPYRWSLEGTLPRGLSFENGLFSGTPIEAGVFTVQTTVSDARGMGIVQSNQLRIHSNVSITNSSPLPPGTAGQSYSVTFTAADGIAPYSWSSRGTLPAGLTLNPSTGVLSGTPAAGGTFTFDVAVTDVTESTAIKAFNVTIALPPLPPATITGVGSSAGAGEQPKFGVRLSQPYPVPVNGTARLAFAADRYGDDPAVLFSNGGRTLPFTIPAGQTDATFGPNQSSFQTGTTAGTITITSSFSSSGTDLTPSPAPQQVVRVNATAPVITKLELNKVSGGFELIVTGYSTPRQMTQAVIKLNPASGSSLAADSFTIPIDGVFTSYYSSSASAPYGSQFRLVFPFFVPQGLTGLASATVTLTNPVGSSAASSVNF